MIPATRGAILVGLLAPLFAAGCFSPNSLTCGDGRICAPDSRCDEQRHRCIPNAQMLPCVGHAESDACTFTNVPGACRAGVCETFFCGDGIVEAELRESCDGAPPPGKSCLDYGFDHGFLGCTATCEPSFEKCSSFSWEPWSIPGDNLTGVWASSADNVYVVGGAVILHWDGSRWSTATMGLSFFDVWGSGPNDVFAVGAAVVAHWDGSRWSTLYGPPWSPWAGENPETTPADGSFVSVWGSGPDDVYAVGSAVRSGASAGVMAHWNGKSWSQVEDPVLQAAVDMTSVWGTGPRDVFVAGALPDGNGYGIPTIFHWDGSGWANVLTPEGWVYGFAGTGPNDVFAVGTSTAHWDGTSWSMMPAAPEQLSAAWAGGGEMFAVGWSGAVFKWDGGSWVTVQATNAPNYGGGIGPGIYGTGRNVFAVGPGPTAFRRGSTGWSAVTTGVPWSAVWAGAADNAYAVGHYGFSVGPQGISHWDGARWSTVWTSDGGPASLNAVWASGAGDVFAVGDAGLVVHWDGTAWSKATAGSEFGNLVSVWGSSATDVFAAANFYSSFGGAPYWALVHWDGTTWSTLLAPPDPGFVTGLWGSGPNDLYIVVFGDEGIYHWDGAALSRVYKQDARAAGGGFSSIWGSGPHDVFAAGYASSGAYAHWDGAQWSSTTSSAGSSSVLSGSGAGDVFGVGGGGLVHLRSGAWEPIRVPANINASGLAVTPGRIFVSGVAGEVHLDRPSVTCVGPERNCNDGWDNDCDGLPDAADPDCAGKVSEQCADLVDDDADGKIDCADPDCVDFPSCKGPRFEQCADLVDNDADGKTDCDDPDCAEFSSCKEVGGADSGAGGAGGKGGAAGAPGQGGVGGAPPPPS